MAPARIDDYDSPSKVLLRSDVLFTPRRTNKQIIKSPPRLRFNHTHEQQKHNGVTGRHAPSHLDSWQGPHLRTVSSAPERRQHLEAWMHTSLVDPLTKSNKTRMLASVLRIMRTEKPRAPMRKRSSRHANGTIRLSSRRTSSAHVQHRLPESDSTDSPLQVSLEEGTRLFVIPQRPDQTVIEAYTRYPRTYKQWQPRGGSDRGVHVEKPLQPGSGHKCEDDFYFQQDIFRKRSDDMKALIKGDDIFPDCWIPIGLDVIDQTCKQLTYQRALDLAVKPQMQVNGAHRHVISSSRPGSGSTRMKVTALPLDSDDDETSLADLTSGFDMRPRPGSLSKQPTQKVAVQDSSRDTSGDRQLARIMGPWEAQDPPRLQTVATEPEDVAMADAGSEKPNSPDPDPVMVATEEVNDVNDVMDMSEVDETGVSPDKVEPSADNLLRLLSPSSNEDRVIRDARERREKLYGDTDPKKSTGNSSPPVQEMDDSEDDDYMPSSSSEAKNSRAKASTLSHVPRVTRMTRSAQRVSTRPDEWAAL